jgi:hypothetical protein
MLNSIKLPYLLSSYTHGFSMKVGQIPADKKHDEPGTQKHGSSGLANGSNESGIG